MPEHALEQIFEDFLLGILTFRSMTDTTVRTPEELEKLIGIRVLATIPKLERRHIARHRSRLLSGC